MSTAEERLRILQMIQEGKVTPEEGASLLSALNTGARPGSQSMSAPEPRMLRVRITDLRSGKTKVNVNIPMGLVNVGLKLGARFVPTSSDVDYDEIMMAIKSGASGKVADIEDGESGEHVEIWVE